MARDWSEFRRGWKPLLAASLGIACCAMVVPFNSFGAIITPLEQEFGWGRGEIQLGFLWFTLSGIAGFILLGKRLDRMSPRTLILWSIPAYACAFAALSLTPAQPMAFYLLFALVGVTGAATTPVTWTKTINRWFDVHRGLALALTLVGAGTMAGLIQWGSTLLVSSLGWRMTFVVLALPAVLIALPLAFFWFRDPGAAEAEAGAAATPLIGKSMREALRSTHLWMMAAAILFIAVAVIGTVINLKPLLTDKGISAAQAAQVAGVVGLSVVVGRLLVGFLIDRYWAPAVAFPLLVLPALACFWLMQDSISLPIAFACAMLLGLALGAETDLLAFLAARYFGLLNYGRLFGILFAVHSLASGIAPALFGTLYDRTGSYNSALVMAAAMFVLGALMLLTLGRYPVLHASGESTQISQK
jgi:MFS transporter, OFA family, oxalate/formate antiporter